MRLCVFNQNSNKAVTLDVSRDTTVEILKELIQVETDVAVTEQKLSWNGKELSDQKNLAALGIGDQDLLILEKRAVKPVHTTANPPLLSPGLPQEEFNPARQRAIEEQIRRQNIEENLTSAMEYTPEAFSRVSMLYVPVVVNNTSVKAFVDTGAQASIMSRACAERCGLMRLVDARFRGVALGVGQATLIGRVHITPVKLGKSFYGMSFSVMETPHPDIILGLDQLRKHLAHIDLAGNVLHIGSEIVPFLSEKDSENGFAEQLMGQGAPGHSPFSNTNNTPQYQPTHTPTNQQPSPVSELIKLGFAHADVVRALRQANGNVDAAAAILFGNHS